MNPIHAPPDRWQYREWVPAFLAWCVLLALYIVAWRFGVQRDAYQAWVDRELLSGSPWINYTSYFLLLTVALLAPGSATILILAALPVFGPLATFVLSFLAGVVATAASHQVGWYLRARRSLERPSDRVRRVQSFVDRYQNKLWLLALLTRAVPNPLYDTWAYAFGFLRLPLSRYLPWAVLGGGLSLAALCFLPGLLDG